MKKLISTLIVLCITVAALIVGQPVQAKRNLEKGQEAINQLMQYVDTPNKKNNNANVEEIQNESLEADPEERVQLTDKEKAKLQQMAQQAHRPANADTVAQVTPPPAIPQDSVEPVQNTHNYVHNNAQSYAAGSLTAWEVKRDRLAKYVSGSEWITWLGIISQGDFKWAFGAAKGFFDISDRAASFFGADFIFDTIKAFVQDKMENVPALKRARLAARIDINDAKKGDSVDRLYVKVQSNALYLIVLEQEDYDKLVAKYPEVAFLFEDLYTFFQWRYLLREYDNDYAMNEDNIHTAFFWASHTNSFFAWWELAIFTHDQLLQAANTGAALTPLSAKEERTNLMFYIAHAKRARYFGRLWNYMIHYATRQDNATRRGRRVLPRTHRPIIPMVPKPSIYNPIKAAFNPLSDEEIKGKLDDIRAHYVKTRLWAKQEWKDNGNKAKVDALIKQYYKEPKVQAHGDPILEGLKASGQQNSLFNHNGDEAAQLQQKTEEELKRSFGNTDSTSTGNFTQDTEALLNN